MKEGILIYLSIQMNSMTFFEKLSGCSLQLNWNKNSIAHIFSCL